MCHNEAAGGESTSLCRPSQFSGQAAECLPRDWGGHGFVPQLHCTIDCPIASLLGTLGALRQLEVDYPIIPN